LPAVHLGCTDFQFIKNYFDYVFGTIKIMNVIKLVLPDALEAMEITNNIK